MSVGTIHRNPALIDAEAKMSVYTKLENAVSRLAFRFFIWIDKTDLAVLQLKDLGRKYEQYGDSLTKKLAITELIEKYTKGGMVPFLKEEAGIKENRYASPQSTDSTQARQAEQGENIYSGMTGSTIPITSHRKPNSSPVERPPVERRPEGAEKRDNIFDRAADAVVSVLCEGEMPAFTNPFNWFNG